MSLPSSEKPPVVILGYSGHGLVAAEAAIEAGLPLQFYAELQPAAANPFNLEYLGFEGADDFAGWGKGYHFILGIGDNRIRSKVAEYVAARGEQLVTVIHPDASVSRTANIGCGVLVARNAAINPLAIIGDYCIINTGCVVEHECRLGNAVHVAPGAVMAGNVHVGDFSFIGANSVIRQGVQVGKGVLVGMGAAVIRNVADGKTVAGNPARNL